MQCDTKTLARVFSYKNLVILLTEPKIADLTMNDLWVNIQSPQSLFQQKNQKKSEK